MGSPKNLTTQITRLRDRKGGFLPEDGEATHVDNKLHALSAPPTLQGRRMANDSFVWFSYALFAAALITQLTLIVWLDLF
jgi:hypothetical protein